MVLRGVVRRVWTFPVAAALLAVVLLVLGYGSVSPTWAGVIAFWFGCLALQYLHGVPSMPRQLTVWHRACTLAFPAVATLVKWHEVAHGGGESVGLSNRLQHFSWAFCTVALFAPTLRRWIRDRTVVDACVMVVGFVAVLGNLNEVGEWSQHAMRWGLAYDDTIRDLIMNALGSVLGAVALVRLAGSESAAGLDRRGRPAGAPPR